MSDINIQDLKERAARMRDQWAMPEECFPSLHREWLWLIDRVAELESELGEWKQSARAEAEAHDEARQRVAELEKDCDWWRERAWQIDCEHEKANGNSLSRMGWDEEQELRRREADDE